MGKWMILGDEEVDDVWLMVLVSVLACVWFNYSTSIDGELGFATALLPYISSTWKRSYLLACLYQQYLLACCPSISFLACFIL